jgi:FHS family L-fucose permease-like MFS transporter
VEQQASGAGTSGTTSGGGYGRSLSVLATLFFMWGFCTVLNDVLVPHLKAVFEMNYTRTLLIQLVFFTSYLFFALPSGLVLRLIGYKRGIMLGLTIMACGCLLFVPAARLPSYYVFLSAFFVLGAGITLLQVAANPYVAVLGSEETSSSRLNLVQALNSLGTVIGPLFGGFLILSRSTSGNVAAGTALTLQQRFADAQTVVLPYIGIAVVLLLLAGLIWATRLPQIPTQAETEEQAHDSIFRHRLLWLGVAAIFLYVGAEVTIGSLLISYMTSPHIGIATSTIASHFVSYYWGAAMVGRFVGAYLMSINAKDETTPARFLGFNCLAAIALIAISVATSGAIAQYTILLVGLCNSIMFPTIFTLAIRRLGPLTGWGSALLIMAIFGGAVLPELQALLADSVGLTISFMLPIVCYIYLWTFARASRNEIAMEQA